MSVWTAWRIVPAAERADAEQALDYLSEEGFVVTSREVSRDGPWRIELFGEGDRPTLAGDWTWEELPEKDWVAENQRSFRPFQVGPFWVHPSHVRDGRPAGLLPIEIDAGLAFGTGTHATTRGCLALLATLDPAETVNAVDVGCGSGILAIAMAKLWNRRVPGGDNDPEAVDVARENAALNGVAALCDFHVADGVGSPGLAARGPFDLIVANILAGPLIELAPSFAAAAAPRATIVLAGLLAEQRDEVAAAYAALGFHVVGEITRETGGALWPTLTLRRG